MDKPTPTYKSTYVAQKLQNYNWSKKSRVVAVLRTEKISDLAISNSNIKCPEIEVKVAIPRPLVDQIEELYLNFMILFCMAQSSLLRNSMKYITVTLRKQDCHQSYYYLNSVSVQPALPIKQTFHMIQRWSKKCVILVTKNASKKVSDH